MKRPSAKRKKPMRTPLLLLIAVAVHAPAAHAASMTFRSPVHVQPSYHTGAVTVADFNGDGRDDLVSLQNNLTDPFLKLAVSLQRSDASLAEVVLYRVALEWSGRVLPRRLSRYIRLSLHRYG
jgi:hypothetical protein